MNGMGHVIFQALFLMMQKLQNGLWQDYAIGSPSQYKQYYYVSQYNITGTELFEDKGWVRLNDKPNNNYYSNFDYKARQFADFYDLESR